MWFFLKKVDLEMTFYVSLFMGFLPVSQNTKGGDWLQNPMHVYLEVNIIEFNGAFSEGSVHRLVLHMG